MVKKKSNHIYEKHIKKVLSRARRPLTTNQLAEKAGVTWKTAKKYAARLNRNGKIKKKRISKNRVYWKK